MDADERITPALANEIRGKVSEDSPFDGFVVHRLNYFLGTSGPHGSWGRDRVTRLFRRDAGRYNEATDHSEVNIPRHQLGQLRERMPHYTCLSYERYLEKMQRYAAQQAELWYRQGRRASLTHLLGNGPMRFLRSYVAEAGFLDGMPGLQVATLTAYYSFLKQIAVVGTLARPGAALRGGIAIALQSLNCASPNGASRTGVSGHAGNTAHQSCSGTDRGTSACVWAGSNSRACVEYRRAFLRVEWLHRV